MFDRKVYFAQLHNDGHFTRADLQKFWHKYTRHEQSLFLSFMQQCEICFIVKKTLSKKSSLENIEYIAPQLLPEQPSLSVRALHRQGSGVYYKYRHIFLHSAIIQRFIVRTGNMAKENEMWQTGIVLDTLEGIALIEAAPNKNEITIRLDYVNQKSLLNKIRNEMKEINADEAGIEELVSLDGISFVNLEHLKKNPACNESIQAENGEWINTNKLKIFLNISEKEVFDKTDTITMQKSKDSKPKKNRIKIPNQNKVRAELQKEVNNKCPFCPSKDVGHFEIHHIDENPGNNVQSNLILVCPTCHSKIDKGDIKRDVVAKKKKHLITEES